MTAKEHVDAMPNKHVVCVLCRSPPLTPSPQLEGGSVVTDRDAGVSARRVVLLLW
jgi:hypothetical protein